MKHFRVDLSRLGSKTNHSDTSIRKVNSRSKSTSNSSSTGTRNNQSNSHSKFWVKPRVLKDRVLVFGA